MLSLQTSLPACSSLFKPIAIAGSISSSKISLCLDQRKERRSGIPAEQSQLNASSRPTRDLAYCALPVFDFPSRTRNRYRPRVDSYWLNHLSTSGLHRHCFWPLLMASSVFFWACRIPYSSFRCCANFSCLMFISQRTTASRYKTSATSAVILSPEYRFVTQQSFTW